MEVTKRVLGKGTNLKLTLYEGGRSYEGVYLFVPYKIVPVYRLSDVLSIVRAQSQSKT